MLDSWLWPFFFPPFPSPDLDRKELTYVTMNSHLVPRMIRCWCLSTPVAIVYSACLADWANDGYVLWAFGATVNLLLAGACISCTQLSVLVAHWVVRTGGVEEVFLV